MVTTEKNSVNVYCIQVFNYQGQYTVSIPSPEGAWGGRSLRVKSAVSAIRDLDVCPAGVPNVNLETGSNVLVCGKNNITAELDVIRHLESCSQLCWGCYVFSHRKSRLAVFQTKSWELLFLIEDGANTQLLLSHHFYSLFLSLGWASLGRS